MKTRNKILICLLLTFGICILFQNNVKAASAKISVSNTNPKPGEKVTVTGSVTAGAWNLNLSGNGKSETIYGYTNTNGNSSGSKSITFTAGNPGEKYSFSLNGGMTDINSDSEENVSKSVAIVVAENKKEDNSKTSSNSTQSNTATTQTNAQSNSSSKDNSSDKNEEKEPTFQTTNKVATVMATVNFRKSYSTKSSSLGKIKEGNTVTIIGTGDNGWSKIEYNGKTGYIKTEYLSSSEEGTEEENEEQNSFGLDLFKIKDLELTPEFSTDIYEYTINTKEYLKQLDIEEAVANTKNAKVEITGNENFVIGENIVKISVSDENGNSVVYRIVVNVREKEDIQNNDSNEVADSNLFDEEMDRIQKEINIKKWIIRGIIVFVTMCIIIMFILRYKTLKQEDEEENYSKKDGYVIIDEKFDALEKDKEKIAKIEQFDEEIEKNKTKELEQPVQPRRMKKTKGKHF